MKVEIPELKRCCFCVPLRYGLLAWGYIKLVPLIFFITLAMITVIQYSSKYRLVFLEEILLLSVLIVIMIADIGLTIVSIVGGHRKSAKLLHVYYIYNIVIMCLFAVFFIWMMGIQLKYMAQIGQYLDHGYATVVPFIQARLLFGIFYLGIQAYIIILIRSEVNKLKNSSTFRFQNPIAETEHTLENGINEQGIDNQKEASNGSKTDNQFEGIINQTKKVDHNADHDNFNYTKF